MKIRYLIAAAMGATLAAADANSASINVVTDDTNVLTTSGLTGFQTDGDDMAGMVVTANFSNTASETLVWSVTGADSGGVNGSLFSLDLSGDSFSAGWNLLNKNPGVLLTDLTIDAGPGDTVFDIEPSGAAGTSTVGSAQGAPFSEQSAPLSGDITATYSNPVQLTGETPVGDIYAMLMADFVDLTDGGLLFDELFTFRADTDNLMISGDLRAVPIPAAWPLLLTALVSLVLFVRRRQTTR